MKHFTVSFIAKISYSLYVNHVVLVRDLRVYGEWDNHFSVGPSDLPRGHFWFFFDIFANYLILIPLSYVTERVIEEPFGKIGN